MDNRSLAKFALNIAKRIKEMSSGLPIDSSPDGRATIPKKAVILFNNEIYSALFNISPSIAYSYAQVRVDILDDNRKSWAGTAHEVREVLTHLLRELAPDDKVKAQSWYKQDSNTVGPTQAQRAKYIIRLKDGGSNTEDSVLKDIALIEDRISQLIRSIYSRASDAAHTYDTRNEVIKILRYFDAVIHDLIQVDN